MRGAAARSIIGFDDVNAAGGRQLPLYTSYTHRWLYFLHSPLAILSTFTVGFTFCTHRWLYFLQAIAESSLDTRSAARGTDPACAGEEQARHVHGHVHEPCAWAWAWAWARGSGLLVG